MVQNKSPGLFPRIKQTIFHASNNIEVPVDLANRKDGWSHSVTAVADLCFVLHGMLGVEQTGRKKDIWFHVGMFFLDSCAFHFCCMSLKGSQELNHLSIYLSCVFTNPPPRSELVTSRCNLLRSWTYGVLDGIVLLTDQRKRHCARLLLVSLQQFFTLQRCKWNLKAEKMLD